MKYILALVEGQTEEAFVIDVLNPYLEKHNLYITLTLTITKRVVDSGNYRGGVVSYGKIKFHLEQLIKNTNAVIITTFFDYCRLDGKDFPGWDRIKTQNFASVSDKVAFLEQQPQADIPDSRFKPYFALHEFEAMLYAEPAKIVQTFPELPAKALLDIQAIHDEFESPEAINDTKPPSQRLMEILSRYSTRYDKPLFGSLISLDIGLDTIRQHCPHFNQWLITLESLSN